MSKPRVFYAESTLYFVESIDTFMADLTHARPNIVRLGAPIVEKNSRSGCWKSCRSRSWIGCCESRFLGGMIRRKIKRGLGLDQARWYASGSAPIATSLLEWWNRLGVPISEGWGMTETFGLRHFVTGRPVPALRSDQQSLARGRAQGQRRAGTADSAAHA